MQYQYNKTLRSELNAYKQFVKGFKLGYKGNRFPIYPKVFNRNGILPEGKNWYEWGLEVGEHYSKVYA